MSSGGLIILGYRTLFFCNQKQPSDKTHKSTETELALPVQIRMCGTKTLVFFSKITNHTDRVRILLSLITLIGNKDYICGTNP